MQPENQVPQAPQNAAPAAVSPELFVEPKEKGVPTWLQIVIAVILLAIVAGVAALLAQNKKDSIAQNNAKTNFAASSNVQNIQQPLELFYSYSHYYPSDISKSTFDALEMQVRPYSLLTAPAGTKYVYTPAPSGCTTAAKNCKAYSLGANNTSMGANIITVNSTAGKTPTLKP